MKIKNKNLNFISKKLDSIANSFLNDGKEVLSIRKIIRSEKIALYRAGFDSYNRRLPPLKRATVNSRRRYEKFNKLSSKYSSNKSNMTYTGKFLTSMVVQASSGTVKRVGSSRVKTFQLFFTGSRLSIKTGEKSKSKRVNNSDIFRRLQELGYNFNGIPIKARIRIGKRFRRYLRRQLK